MFEIKNSVRFSSITAALEVTDKLKFDPTVRQAQQLAQEMSAPYFAVSDGVAVLWFDVDQETGRPHLLENPVLPQVKSDDKKEFDKNKILRTSFDLADFSRGYLAPQEYIVRVGVVVLARLLTEQGNSELENLLSAANSDLESYDKAFSDLSTHKYANDVDFYNQAISTTTRLCITTRFRLLLRDFAFVTLPRLPVHL